MTYVWLTANSTRARRKLPASAECFSVPTKGNPFGGRYVYRLPVSDFDPRMLGGGYHGNITKARVDESLARKCWSS